MSRGALFRRREVWLPTLWGWTAILLVLALASLLVVRNLYSFLAPDAPVGARVLVVEGWMGPDELEQAAEIFKDRGYERAFTTGGPIPAGFEELGRDSFADLARDFLLRRGLPEGAVTSVPTPASAQDRSFLSAVMLREWVAREGLRLDALDLLSSGVHSRRSRLLYRIAFGPDVRIGILAARSNAYNPSAWWRTSVGAKTVLSETIGLIWTKLFFRPGEPGSEAEKWGRPDTWSGSPARARSETLPGRATNSR
jgi:hypothetical protein